MDRERYTVGGEEGPGGGGKLRRNEFFECESEMVVARTTGRTLLALLTLCLAVDCSALRAAPWTYSQLHAAVRTKQVSSATVLPNLQVHTVGRDGLEHSTQIAFPQVEGLVDEMTRRGVDVSVAAPSTDGVGAFLLNAFPFALLAYLAFSVARQMRRMSPDGAAEHRQAAPVETTFADVAGMHETKLEMQEVVEFLRRPDKYAALGARVPRGVLLDGPPGTGKTLLARATAGEAGVPFFATSGSTFVQMFVGVGAQRVRELFEKAGASGGPAVIFIDEIDAIGRARGSASLGGGGDQERESTLNQLLTCMDGFTSTGVIVLAATNRAELLDEALRRPGRFDRKITIGLPSRRERYEILQVHARNKPVDDREETLWEMARDTAGFSGAQLEACMNDAAVLAARANATSIDRALCTAAVERETMGLPKGDASPQELVAYHEAGHALAASFVEGGARVRAATIVPRSRGAGGFTAFEPEDDEGRLTTRKELFARLVTLFGGRAAEIEVFGPDGLTAGAAHDIQQATSLARAMVFELGLGEAAVDYDQVDGDRSAEVIELLGDASEAASALIKQHRPLLDRVARELLDRLTLSGDAIRDLL